MSISTIRPHRHFGPFALALLSLVLAAAGALAGGSAPAAADRPADIGVVIIKKVVVGDPSDTTSFSGTIVKAQGNQLIGTFTTLAQGSDLRYTDLANGTYDVTENESTLLGYWKADGDATCPAGPSTRPNQNKAVISDVVKVVTVCVYNEPAPTVAVEVGVEGGDDPAGDDTGDDVIDSSVVPGDDGSQDDVPGDDQTVVGGDVPHDDVPGEVAVGGDDGSQGDAPGDDQTVVGGDDPQDEVPGDVAVGGDDGSQGDAPGGDQTVVGGDDPQDEVPGDVAVGGDDGSQGDAPGDEEAVAGDDSEGANPGDDDDDLLVLIIEDTPAPGTEVGIIDEVSSDVAAGPYLAPGAPSTGSGLQPGTPRSSLGMVLFALAFMSAGGGLVLAEHRPRE